MENARPMDHAGAPILAMRDELARAAVEAQFARWPDLYARYGSVGRDKCVDDVRYHLLYLAEAVGADAPGLFAAYASWAKVLFAGLGIPAGELGDSLILLRDLIAERVGGDAARRAAACVDAAVAALPSVGTAPPTLIDPDAPHADLACAFLDALVAGDRRRATAMVMERVDGGMTVRDAYLHVFQPVLREIGRLWQTGRISVAHEHFATAATQAVMSMLYPRIFAAERCGRSMVATCVSGELHEIGIRMVADFFEMAGWDSYYLGANAPTRSIVRAMVERDAHVLAISATITPHVGTVAELVRAVRAEMGERPLRIIVGGYPFLLEPDLWRVVGADGSAQDAEGAVELAERLLDGK
ncbi:cobalamin B12-binding domain-containing protein [Azospirillum sp.]|uniref:cobalamin B12-binding domain-containing protein n=1 Tax=Azospirillum sp. TaxID=34012 RepID=UPI002D4DAF8C|nr:cobalamin-dependent protein [Azospirillum sp.]HYD66219.1 cobalamin-dependent protein [Azospirillum sp.]